jgi:hypothetical protein
VHTPGAWGASVCTHVYTDGELFAFWQTCAVLSASRSLLQQCDETVISGAGLTCFSVPGQGKVGVRSASRRPGALHIDTP